MKDLLLRIVRDDFLISDPALIAELSTENWESLFNLAHRLKISPLLYKAAQKHIPTTVKKIYDESNRKQAYLCRANQIALNKIDAACTEENLRFILFKGMAASLLIYGDENIRQAGDIDVLVANEDLFRFNYVMRKAGFFQPDIVIGAKAKDRQLSRLLQYRSGLSAPYPKRRKSSSDQLIPYYDADLPCRVEAHDGYESLPASFITETLWSVTKLRIGDVRVRIPDIDHFFVLLLVTAHVNSHGYFSATDGEVNLRDYVDIRYLLKNQASSLCFEKVEKIIEKYDLHELAADTISLYKQIYNEEQFLPLSFNPSSNMTLDQNFVDRLFDPCLCAELAATEIKSHCSLNRVNQSNSANTQFIKAGKWFKCRNRFDLDIRFSVKLTERDVIIQWQLPTAVVSDLNLFAFKIALIPSVSTSYFEFSISCYSLMDGTRLSCWCKNSRLTPRFEPEQSEGSVPTKISHESTTSTLTTIMPFSTLDISPADRLRGIGVIPRVYLRDSVNSFCDINDHIEYSKIQYILS